MPNDMVHMDKPRRSKTREVSSRFLSPTPPADLHPPPSPNQTLSPHRHKPRSSTDSRTEKHHHHRSTPAFIRGLWPSATSTPTPTPTPTPTTLADYLGKDRRKDSIKTSDNNNNSNNAILLNRQRSCTEFNRFENPNKQSNNSKENHKPLFSGSIRGYTSKFKLTGRSSTSSPFNSSDLLDNDHHVILPGRLSVDENALRRKSFARRLDSFSDESEDLGGSPITGKNFSAAPYMAPTLSSRKSGKEVPSKYMNPVSLDNSPKKSTIKNAMKRANSLTLPSKWEAITSPGRTESPPGGTPSFSSLKPPTSPSRTKNFLNIGLDLIKGKKSGSSGCLSPLGPGSNPGTVESVHQLRMMHNRLVQWGFANARAEVVNESIANQAERNLVSARDGITKLRHSVLQKKLQLEKQKLEMKLNFIVRSQIKLLEAWGDLERQHLAAVSMTKDALHSVVCRVPLIEGAKVEPQSASIALRHASDLTASIKSMLSTFSPTAEEAVLSLSELAEVATQEKSLLEECLEHFRALSTLEMQERSLKCTIMQIQLAQQQQQQQLEIPA